MLEIHYNIDIVGGVGGAALGSDHREGSLDTSILITQYTWRRSNQLHLALNSDFSFFAMPHCSSGMDQYNFTIGQK